MNKLFISAITTIALVLLCSSITFAQTGNWNEVGPINFPTNVSGQINGIGRVEQIKFDPVNPLRMYAVCPRAVFISNDTATTWAVLAGTDDLPTNTAMASICIDHTNNSVLYIGTGDANYYGTGSGVWKSTDGGATFNLSNNGMGNKLVVEIVMSSTDNNTLVAAANDGLYKSTNAGATWVLTSPVAQMTDLVVKAVVNSNTLYAVARNNQNIYISNDFGSTWTTTALSATLPSNGGRVAVTPANPNVVYVGYVGSNTTGPVKGGIIYQSTDAGATFTMKKGDDSPNLNGYNGTSTGQGNYNWEIEADPLDANTLYTCAHIIWKSTNGGTTWVQAQASWAYILHTDQHHMVFNPNNHNQLFNANDGGVWINRDHVATNTWTPKSNGLAATEFYTSANSHGYKYLIGGGTQDNGEVFYKDNTWKTNRGGDWTSKYFTDNTNANRFVYVQNGKYRDLMNSPSSSEVSFGVPATTSNNDLYAASYQDANTGFYAQSNTSGAVYGLYKTTNLQTTTPVWTAVNGFTPTVQMYAMAVSPADANILYILSRNKTVVRSTDALGAATFTSVASAPMPSGTPSNGGLAVLKSGVVYMSSDGYVFRSGDQGVTWLAVGSGPVTTLLNGQKIKEIIADTSQAASEVIYAITSQGVYYKKTTINDWAFLGAANLPTVASITDMDIYYDPNNSANSALRISTYGRGLWECSLQAASGMPPVVTFTTPQNNAAIAAGSSVNITVGATDADGSITKVEFFINGLKVGEDATSPYTYAWNNIAAGGYVLSAKATDNSGAYATGYANVNAVVACPGSTNVSKGNLNLYYYDSQEISGENGAASNAVDGNTGTIWHTQWSGSVAPLPHELRLSLGTTYTVNSFKYLPRQSGTNGRVGQYEIYVSTDSLNWGTPVATGTFANDATEKVVSFAEKQGKFVRFRALSEVNGQQYSSAAEINVGICNQGIAPTVAITSPANNASFNTPVNINIDATASDADGSVTKVEFYEGANKLGEDLTAPYSFTWNNVAVGSYALTARATDNAGLITTSAVVNITVANPNVAPTVSVTAPANNAVFTAPATVNITATASDTDGTVTKVEFFQGAVKLGEDLTSPYSYSWSGVAAGSYAITARATDNNGAVTTSSVINITVNFCTPAIISSSLVSIAYVNSQETSAENGSATNVLDDNTSTIWHTKYSGTTDPYPHEVQLDLGATYAVTSFRYLPRQNSTNGRVANYEIYVSNSTSSWGTAVATGTFANDATEKIVTFNEKSGRYVRFRALSEVNGNAWASAAELKVGGCYAGSNTSPTVSITSPANNASFTAPATITINANASDADGSINKVEFFNGSTKLGEDLTSPYSYTWNNVAAGSYTLTAVATDNIGATTTSTAVAVTVNSNTTLSPIADSYVRDGNTYKNQNYGTSTALTVKKDVTAYNREIFMKFNLNGAASFNTALLRLNIASAGITVTNTTWSVYYVSSDSWTETGVTWNNKPASTTLLATVQGQSSGWVEWNISAQALSEFAGDKTLSLRIVSTVIDPTSDATFNSKEVTTTSVRPQLLLTNTPGTGINPPVTVMPLDFTIKAWPNPSNSEFTLDITGSSQEKVYIRVTNTNGQVVQQLTTTTNQIVSFGEKLNRGVYYVEVRQGETRKLVKLVKQ
ncbi:DNRLRE domain-containing protein [Lacibacter luteus]|uniref:DNRLRE domain-containing protein n=1 Tax=Lacibacter luteus TaxID=2508719 RepID=A0A4Q1CDJ9_9BACT|nr:Ig-like domain-containing protein [Lacibacter luteus]RXK57733.1 DNRLRE domain-containing protein [Lacibacter luteus]